MSEKKILLVDGNNAAWRLMKRLPPLSVDGEPVQVIYGFLRLLRGLLMQFEPNVALVCWDSGRSEFRQKAYPDYKGNRNRDGEDVEYISCIHQMQTLQTLLKHLNIIQLAKPGTEADDLIGLACRNIVCLKIVASSDTDMLQLVNGDTLVWSPNKSILYTERNFKRNSYGLTPRQFLEMRALCGDTSDNIKGVARGFGETTARELLIKYGSIENLFSTSVEREVFKRGNRYALLYGEGTKEIAYRNLLVMDLAVCGAHVKDRDEILRDLKHSIDHRHRIDKTAVRKIFMEKVFKSLLRDFAVWISPFENLDWSEK